MSISRWELREKRGALGSSIRGIKATNIEERGADDFAEGGQP
jgi:hypothetical protein